MVSATNKCSAPPDHSHATRIGIREAVSRLKSRAFSSCRRILTNNIANTLFLCHFHKHCIVPIISHIITRSYRACLTGMAPRTFAKPRYRCKKTSTEQSSSLDVLNDQSPSSSIILPQSEHPSGSHSRISEPSVLEPVPFSGPSPFPPFMEAPQDTPTLPPPGYGSWNDSTFRVRARATTRPSAHSSQLSLHRTPMPPPRTSLSDEHAMPQSMDGLVSSHGMDAFADTFSPAIAPPTRLPAIDGPTASSATDALMLLFAMADASETSSDSDESAILPATAHPARYPAAVGPASSSATNAPVQADAARPHGSRNRIMKIGRSSNPRVAPPPIVQRIASRGNHGPEARSVDTANAQASLEEAWNLVNYQTSNNPAHRVPILPPFDLQTRRVPISKQGVCGGCESYSYTSSTSFSRHHPAPRQHQCRSASCRDCRL